MNDIVKPDNSLYRLLLESNIDAIIVFDAAMVILEWNHMAELVYGKLRVDVVGKPLEEAIPALSDDPETVAAIALALKQVKSFVPASSKISHRARIENHYIPLVSATGFSGVMNTGHDMSHRIIAETQLEALNHRLEKQYQQLQRTTAELASLTSLSSLEIKEPIRQIYTSIENLIKTEASRLSDGGKAGFRRIQSYLNRMNHLLDDMLNLTGISMLEKPLQTVQLNLILEQAVDGLQKIIAGKGVKITWEKLCTVRGHTEQLRLLFHHLLVCAINFNEKQDPVLSLSCDMIVISRHPEILFSEREYYKITIGDNGTDFEMENPAEIFTVFEKFQTDRKGRAGAGLVIASKIMDVHDGFIYVEKKPGYGFFFYCFFPVIEEQASFL